MSNLNINSFVSVIDNEDINEIEKLVKSNKENNGNDVILEMYSNSLLTPKRLNYIMENCKKYFKITSILIKKLIKDKNIKLLDIIFANIKFYDNEFILKLLLLYKNKTITTTSDLNHQISNEKYKFSKGEKYLSIPEKYLFSEDNITINKVQFLVEHGADINKTRNNNGETPFFVACEKGTEAIIKYLVKHGADINKEERSGKSPLFSACKNKNKNEATAIAKYLVEHGADINKETKDENTSYLVQYEKDSSLYFCETPLFYACRSRNEALVKYLVEKGADVNKENKSGETPLYTALCYIDNEAVVKCLVEHGADVNKGIKEGLGIPFFRACFNGNEALVKYLVEHGADINKNGWNGESALFSACENENVNEAIAIVKYLVEHGIDINKENNNGKTSLFNACKKGNEALVKYLIKLGADINKEENDGKSLLYYACENKNENEAIAIVKYLVEQGADTNKVVYWTGETPLFNACKNVNENEAIAIVKCLVEHGADINKEDENGKTSLFNACENGNEVLVKYLVEHGADVNKVERWFKETPLFYACRNENENKAIAIMKNLIEHGANINYMKSNGETPLSDARCSIKKAIEEYLVKQ